MSSVARQIADALFGAPVNSSPAAAQKALLEHQHAVQRWLAAPLADRPHYWRAVETAWRRVKQSDGTLEAQRAATTLARDSGKLRSHAR